MAFVKSIKMFFSFFWITLSISIIIISCGTSSSQKLPSICESSCKKSINSTETEKYCNQHPDLHVEHRCCVNSSSSVILGIDLQDCDQTIDKFSEGIVNMSHLVIISLEGNPIKEVDGKDFSNNLHIEYLSLPPNVLCPGANYSWKSEEYSTNHTVCSVELNPCFSPRNYTCLDNSYCLHVGVNMTNCLCEKGYRGYKCLNEGDFPFVQFGLGLGIPTVILCVFLWVTQRRYVKTTPKNR